MARVGEPENPTSAAAGLCYRQSTGRYPHKMSTCPHCKGHLTDGHRCPRRRGFVVLEVAACAIGGAVASLLLLAFFDPFLQATDLDAVAMVAGALVAVGINRFLRS